MSTGPEWFEPKSYGYGSGLPIAWQGWVVLGLYLAVVFVAIWLFQKQPLAIFAILVPATALLLLVTARTTRGGWRWRWGGRD